MMKFTEVLLVACLAAASVSAFSAVAPKADAGAVKLGDIDRSMKGIDEKGSFDPVQGENAALKRNNKNEVWVPQVRLIDIYMLLICW